MLIAAHHIMFGGKRKPYQCELEFLESTGTQWIDTGVKPTSDTQVEITYKQPAAQSNVTIFGSRTAYNDRSYCIWADANGYIRFDYSPIGSYSNANGPSSIVGDYVVVKKNGRQNFVNGTEYTANNAATFTCAGNAYLFAINNNGTADFRLSAQISACKIYENGVLVRDLIPVLDWDGNAKMFDRVSGTYPEHYGTFVGGPEIHAVEYIESSGTQYIKTGLTVASRMRIKGAFDTSAICRVFGGRAASGSNQFDLFQYANDAVRPSYGTTSVNVAGIALGYHEYDFDDNVFKVDGVAKHTFTAQTFSATSPLYIGTLSTDNSGTAATARFNGKIYPIQIYANGVLTRDYKPIRVGSGSTWEGAMLDTVNRRVYRNAGTGAFAYGNDV